MSLSAGNSIVNPPGHVATKLGHTEHDSNAGMDQHTEMAELNLGSNNNDSARILDGKRAKATTGNGNSSVDTTGQATMITEHNVHDLQAGMDKNTGLENSKMGRNNNAYANNLGGNRANTSIGNGKQSYASLFKDNRVPNESSLLQYYDPPVGEVVLGIDEIDSVEETHGFCLVGYVMGPRPRPFAVLNFIKGWGGDTKFYFMDNGWIKFKFASEGDRDRVLNGGKYMIMGRQLYLKIMPSCFLFSKEDMEFVPTWIQIVGLPKECLTNIALGRIASVVGKPIHTDMLTISKKGDTYARILVELDAKKPRVWEYSVKMPNGKSTLVGFKYESDPKYCGKCNSLGHTTDLCGMADGNKNRNNNARYRNTNQTRDATKGKEKEVNKGDDIPGKHRAETETSVINTSVLHADPALEPQIVQEEGPRVDKGKGIAVDDNEVGVGQGRMKSVDYGGNFLEDSESNDCLEEGYDLDSDDIDKILSKVEMQDKDEWKTVPKKTKKKAKKKKKGKQGPRDILIATKDSDGNIVDTVKQLSPDVNRPMGTLGIDITGTVQPSSDVQQQLEPQTNEGMGQNREIDEGEGDTPFDDSASQEFISEGNEVDSDDLEDFISPITVKDKSEWKTVQGKKSKAKKKITQKKVDKGKIQSSEASTWGTTNAPYGLRPRGPVQGDGSRHHKKEPSEVRPPDTASILP